MRYTNQKAFEKHLAASAPDHLLRLYLILSVDDYERKCAIDAVLATLSLESGPVRFLPNAELRAIVDSLSTQPLFGGESVAIVDEAPAKLIESLSTLFDRESLPGLLILGSKSKISSRVVEKHGVILDLLEEKSWEKEKRWTEMLYEMAKSRGKRLLPDAAAWMIEHLEQSTSLFAQEMEKLLLYTGSRTLIERKDAEAICVKSRTATHWQLAEELVWEKTTCLSHEPDGAMFHALLANLRTQLMMGAKMHALHLSGVPYQDWGAHFPKVWPRALEKKAHAASRLGHNYFKEGLKTLFEIELLAKGSALSQDVLFDTLRLRLAHAKS